jgi:hypothetical protein
MVFLVTATRSGMFMSAPAWTEEERPALTDAAGLLGSRCPYYGRALSGKQCHSLSLFKQLEVRNSYPAMMNLTKMLTKLRTKWVQVSEAIAERWNALACVELTEE